MKKTLSVFIAVALLTECGLLYASPENVGTSGAAFLKLPAGSRPSSMGGAFAGIADDVNAIFFNPAGTGKLEKSEFTAQYGLMFQSISHNLLGFAYPTKIGSIGLGVVNLGVDKIERRSIADTPKPSGEFSSRDTAYILNYSKKIGEKISAGLNVKFISLNIDDKSASSFGADAGLLIQPFDFPLSAGLAVQNLGTEAKFETEGDPLPLNIKIGFGYKLLSEKLSLGAGIDLPRDNSLKLSLGGEFTQKLTEELSVAARAGYVGMSEEKLEKLAGLSAGAGITFRHIGFDFAWVPYGILGDTMRYSIIVKF